MIAILAVCCVGGIVLFFGGILTLDFMAGPQYTNETVGNYVFKIPVGYERIDNPNYVEFRNGTKFIMIDYSNSFSQFSLYDFALLISSDFGGIEGKGVDINGTPAYKFDTQEIGTQQSAYSYAINIQGDNYLISMSRDVQILKSS